MTYAIKEIFKTLQGEGAQSGRVAVLCRFAGCNLWSGHERDRSTAICRFCDTDFVGLDGTLGGRYANPECLTDGVVQAWDSPKGPRFVVLTGGEPLLQVDEPLLRVLRQAHFEIALETNGTIPLPRGVDWVCVSPKAGADIVVKSGDELKLVFPQSGAPPELYEGLCFKRLSLQPMDGPNIEANTASAIAYCLAHPKWHLSIQTHKFIGIR